MQITVDVAQGLQYMHHDSKIDYIHNYIKSSSILVTEPRYRARICHLGTSYLAGEYEAFLRHKGIRTQTFRPRLCTSTSKNSSESRQWNRPYTQHHPPSSRSPDKKQCHNSAQGFLHSGVWHLHHTQQCSSKYTGSTLHLCGLTNEPGDGSLTAATPAFSTQPRHTSDLLSSGQTHDMGSFSVGTSNHRIREIFNLAL